MTAPSEQEWRDALADLFWMDLQRGLLVAADIDDILAALAPLRERERQQARQEALTEAADVLSGVERGMGPSDWRDGVGFAALRLRSYLGGVS